MNMMSKQHDKPHWSWVHANSIQASYERSNANNILYNNIIADQIRKSNLQNKNNMHEKSNLTAKCLHALHVFNY